MLKSFRKLVKQFQSMPEREFRNGRTKDQALEHIACIKHHSGYVQELRAYLYSHDPDIRRAAASALNNLDWSARNEADRLVWGLAADGHPDMDNLSAAGLLSAWEAETSLAPGAYWAPVVLAGLVNGGQRFRPDLYTVAQDHQRSMNTRTLALWSLGIRGEQDGRSLSDLYGQENNHRVQRSTIQALRFCGPEATSVLGDILDQEADEDLCLELALALAGMGQEAVPALRDRLENETRRVREYAGLALLALADPQGLTLLYAIKSSTRDGRLKALVNEWMIAMHGDSSTWEELSTARAAAGLCSRQRIQQAMTRADNQVLDMIFVSQLAHIPGGGSIPVVQDIIRSTDREELVFEACQAMGGLGARLELQAFLGQGNPLVRTYACLALLATGFPVMQALAET